MTADDLDALCAEWETNGTRPGVADRDDGEAEPWRHKARPPVDLDAIGVQPIDWLDFWATQPTGEEWCVQPILPRGRQAAIFSPPGIGKSLLAADIALAKATGRSILGQPALPPAGVVYLDLEMTEEDLHERLPDLGYGPDDDLSRLHYYQLPTLPPLDTPEGGDVLMAIVDRYAPELVIIDTMARVVEGDENSADTYRAFYRCTGCRLKAAGVALLRLDHQGKDPSRGQRGSSSKADDLDLVWRLVPVEDYFVLHRIKSRVSYVPAAVPLNREIEPALRHVLAPTVWPPGTAKVAALLDDLGVALAASSAVAMEALKTNKTGRRRAVVLAAQRLRQMRAADGNRTGNRSSKPRTSDAEPVSEPVTADPASPQVATSVPVPGTGREPVGTGGRVGGNRVPSRSGEPVPDLLDEARRAAHDGDPESHRRVALLEARHDGPKATEGHDDAPWPWDEDDRGDADDDEGY